MARRLSSYHRGIGTTVATIILLAIVVTITFTVTFWIQGISSQYATFERVEIVYAICSKDKVGNDDYWRITFKLKNPGTTTVSFAGIMINEIEVTQYDEDSNLSQGTSTNMSKGQVLDIGESKTYRLFIDDEYPSTTTPYTSGTTVSVKFHSSTGMDYTRTLELI